MKRCGHLIKLLKVAKHFILGLSNYDGETTEKAAAILNDLKCPFVINQNKYSIFGRTIEKNGIFNGSNKHNIWMRSPFRKKWFEKQVN